MYIADVASSPRKKVNRSWSSNQEPPPDVIANGIKESSDVS